MKKFLAILLSMLLVFSLVACSSTDSDKEDIIKLNDSVYDKTGYFKDIDVSNYVTLNNLETVDIEWADIEAQIREQLDYYTPQETVTDRAVVDGDILNIDYVGYFGDEAFEGGSTNGTGTFVHIGETQYIDDFIDQLIGHMPGETFDVLVTFPNVYENNPAYSGKDAKFVVTINYILEFNFDAVEWNDDFVESTYKASLGITTTKEAEDLMIQDAVFNAFYTAAEFNENVPGVLVDWMHASTVDYIKDVAKANNMTYDEYLSLLGISSDDELKEVSLNTYADQIRIYLLCQAIAEQIGYKVSDEDINAYLEEINANSDNVTTLDDLNDAYGENYVKALIMYDYVQSHLVDNVNVNIIR